MITLYHNDYYIDDIYVIRYNDNTFQPKTKRKIFVFADALNQQQMTGDFQYNIIIANKYLHLLFCSCNFQNVATCLAQR